MYIVYFIINMFKPVVPVYPVYPVYPVIWPWSGSYNHWTKWNDSHGPPTENKMPVAPDPIIVKTRPATGTH